MHKRVAELESQLTLMHSQLNAHSPVPSMTPPSKEYFSCDTQTDALDGSHETRKANLSLPCPAHELLSGDAANRMKGRQRACTFPSKPLLTLSQTQQYIDLTDRLQDLKTIRQLSIPSEETPSIVEADFSSRQLLTADFEADAFAEIDRLSSSEDTIQTDIPSDAKLGDELLSELSRLKEQLAVAQAGQAAHSQPHIGPSRQASQQMPDPQALANQAAADARVAALQQQLQATTRELMETQASWFKKKASKRTFL
eukprot:NODE_3968_length_865_cov_49.521680_g3813_i0.p1 GENE.NODE_3968_length_865_cov_49.521680_g3813_i0~~NODE_3968_length_865_cov_49.521680_g3813_i0.p1  ORF type:complete len:285 (-),score=60.32 NODE_3968_length_865_cov_49.521680_g3813_i0:9-773(-)